MRVTIIPEDKVVIVDGVAAILGTLEADENIHAIQWHGDYGTIEYKVGAAARFTDVSIIGPFVTAHADDVAKVVAAPQPQEPTSFACSPWQMRKVLNAFALRQVVEDAVAASEDQTVKDGWEFATEFRSNDPLVLALGAAVGKTEAEVKDLIHYAASL